MIKVNLREDEITIKGHAMFDEAGKDIVCASVSSIVTTSVNAILSFDKNSIEYKVNEGFIDIKIINNNETTKKLLDNMISLLDELASDYPKNIKIERE